MGKRLFVACMPLIVRTLGVALAAGAHAAEHAHVHGVVTLNVAVDANQVSVQIEAPLDSLVGFEHAPRTAAQKQAVQTMFDRFAAPQSLVELAPTAQCTLAKSSAVSDALSAAADRKPSADEDHADLDATLEFGCKQAVSLRSIDVAGLLQAFPRIVRIEAQIASPAGQFKRTLKRPDTLLRW